jgi:apolipoprotein D and lipocalin family protein
MKPLIFMLLPLVAIMLFSCSVPKELRTDYIPSVPELDLEKYSGTWFEIIRLDHSFERGLQKVTATYSIRDDGKIKVINKGYDTEDQEWSEAEGKAYVPDPNKPGELKVSFFLWFYGDYKVIKLDKDYQWAMITSNSKEYLWILSRTSQMDQSKLDELLDFAKSEGFPLEEIIYVEH